MAVPTILRIKRRLDETATDNIVVAFKRPRHGEETEVETHLQRFLTVDKKGTDEESTNRFADHLMALKTSYKQPPRKDRRKVHSSIRASKSNSIANRYKIVSSKRGIDSATGESESEGACALEPTDCLVLDATPEKNSSNEGKGEDIITCNGQPMKVMKVDYVYDLYYTTGPSRQSDWINQMCEIRPCDAVDYFASPLVNDCDSSDSEVCFDDDDENAEDNWRNDYPDEDDDFILHEFEDENDDYLADRLRRACLDADEDRSCEEFCTDDESFDKEEDFDSGACRSDREDIKASESDSDNFD